MSEEVKDKFVQWYERIIPGLVSLLLAIGVWQINQMRQQIGETRASLGNDIAAVKEKITDGQVQTNGLVLQMGWLSDRVTEFRQTQVKLEERIRALEQSP